MASEPQKSVTASNGNVVAPYEFLAHIDPRLVLVTQDPINAELPLQEQRGVITPNELFYLRNRFHFPRLDTQRWTLQVGNARGTSASLSYADLLAMPSRTVLSTMECAGNGRIGLHPPAEGEPWQYGAVSTAEWTGVPLAEIISQTGLDQSAAEVLAEGADGGVLKERPGRTPFARSLPMRKAQHPDTLVALAMNGVPLPVEHGFPARLIVPGWYGMASVKWLTHLTTLHEPFQGFFQRDRYILPPGDGENEPRPLQQTGVRSVILQPTDGATVSSGTRRIRGLAWSGEAPVDRVEISLDGGSTWRTTEWTSASHRYAWRRWECTWEAVPGPSRVMSRARDADGRQQPVQGEWNLLGYANNAIQEVRVTVTA